VRGNEKKRGYVAAIVAVVAFVGAGWLIYKNSQATKSDDVPAAPVEAS
jgi:hypothetical protein